MHLHSTKQPSLLSLYFCALKTQNRFAQWCDETHKTKLKLTDVSINNSHVNKYARLCGFTQNSSYVPLIYPHLLAFKLQLQLMLHKSFPYPVMGLVHLNNEITRYHDIGMQDILDIQVEISGHVYGRRGVEFEILSSIYRDNILVWQSKSGYLFRSKKLAIKQQDEQHKKTLPTPIKKSYLSLVWPIKSNLGRRYAWLSGDSNPIHLHPWAARLFGFKQAIGHGMCMKAMIAAALPDKTIHSNQNTVISVRFLKPVFLPSQILFFKHQAHDGYDFKLMQKEADGQQAHTYVEGELRYIDK